MWQLLRGRAPPAYDPFSHIMAVPYSGMFGDVEWASSSDDNRTIDLLKHQKDGLSPGGVDLRALLSASTADHQRMPFVEDAARCLTDEEYARTTMLNNDIPEVDSAKIRARTFRTVTNRAFFSAITLLVAWGLFEWCTNSDIYTYGKFFLVPKGLEFWRVIVDMRIAARLCLSPPPVNFPLIRTLLIEIASLSYKTGLWAVTGDFAFWFYQIPCSPWLQRLFGIEVEDPVTKQKKFAKMRCCPMGFSYSPRWATALGWMVILHREANDPDTLGVFETWGVNPPSFVRLRRSPEGETVGFIFLWIDNVLVITNDQQLRDKWFNRLEANARHFRCLWKTDSKTKCSSLLRTSSPTYIGIHFRRVGTMVRWCHESERTAKWKDLLALPILTPRQVARHIGVAQWHQMITLQPLFSIDDAIEIGRRISKRVRSKKDWDIPLSDLGLTLPEADIRVLRHHVRRARKNDESSPRSMPARTRVRKTSLNWMSSKIRRPELGESTMGLEQLFMGTPTILPMFHPPILLRSSAGPMKKDS